MEKYASQMWPCKSFTPLFFKAGQNDKLNKVSLLPLRLAFGLMSNVAFHTNTKAVATWLS